MGIKWDMTSAMCKIDRKKWTLLFLFITLGVMSYARSKPFFLPAKEYANGFLKFSNKKTKKAGQNIDQYLQLAVFQNLLENLGDSLPHNWKTVFHINNKNVLSLTVHNTDKDESRHFVFNAVTGAVIDIQDMINVNGISHIKRTLIRGYEEAVALPGSPYRTEGREQCIKEDIHNFKLTHDTLLVYAERCIRQDSSGNSVALALEQGFDSHKMVKYLTQYGLAMFGLERKLKMKKMYSLGVPGLYAGRQDNEAVLLQLDAPLEKQLSGVLYYTKSKKAVPLSGTFRNNRLETSLGQGKLTLVISAGQVQGTIKNGNRVVSNLILEKQ